MLESVKTQLHVKFDFGSSSERLSNHEDKEACPTSHATPRKGLHAKAIAAIDCKLAYDPAPDSCRRSRNNRYDAESAG